MIVELLHRVASLEDRASRHETHFYPRPSLAGPERCERQMVYWGSGEEPDRPIAGRALHVFNDGHFHELLTNDWIGKTAFRLHSDQMTVVTNDFGLKLEGRIDGVVTDLMGVDRLYEHKGINHFTWERYAKGGVLPEDNLTQCAIYLRGLSAVNPDICEGLLILKNKNTSAFLEYRLRYDVEADRLEVVTMMDSNGNLVEMDVVREGIVRVASEKFLAVLEWIHQGRVPARPYEQKDWHCQYCQFRQRCWSGYAKELSLFVDEAELDAELADAVRYHAELGAQISEQEKERKAIGQQLMKVMTERRLKKGRSGEYELTLVVNEREKINWETVPASVQAEVDRCKEVAVSSFVRVRKLKAEVA